MTRGISQFDVIVAGGGPAGICAAVQAARAGARTLLVEKTGLLGGTTTSAGVNFPGLFHAHGRQVIAGIGWDLLARAVREGGDTLPDFKRDHHGSHWRHHVAVNVAVYAALADELVDKAGVTLLLHTLPAAVRQNADGSWALDLCCKEGMRQVSARILVDATGDANLAALAGCRLEHSRRLQPATLMMQASGYDPYRLDFRSLEEALARAVRRREISYADFGRKEKACEAFLCARGRNRNHIPGMDAFSSADRTAIEVAGRQSMLRIIRFFRKQPGLAGFRIDSFGPECGIRETRTIAGRVCVTGRDYCSGRRWPDALCYSYYPIDIHCANGRGIDIRPLRPGVLPTVPRRALLPAGVKNFLVAGRCLSSDHVANSALRTQAGCMATGQAAGALAALAARAGCDPEQLPLGKVRALLRKHGAIVPK
jgi:hypothetical protein